MTMQQAIKEFQDNGNREIIDRVLRYAKMDLLEYREYTEQDSGNKVILTMPHPEMYIAYRARYFLDRISEWAVYYTNDINYDDEYEDKEYYDDNEIIYDRYCYFMELVDYIRSQLNIEGDPNDHLSGLDGMRKPYTVQSFDDLLEIKNEPWFKDYLNYNLQEDWEGFYDNIDFFLNHNQILLDDKQIIWDELERDYIVPALQYAFERVDCTRTTKEIVKYVNKAFLTHFVVEQNKLRGLIRIQREIPIFTYDYNHETRHLIPTRRKSLYVKFKWSDAYTMVLGDSYHVGLDMDKVCKLLQARQLEFLEEVIQAVNEEVQAQNKDAFKMNNDGGSILNYRYLANKLDIEESNLKHKLIRIRKRIKDNWDEVVVRIKKQDNYFFIK